MVTSYKEMSVGMFASYIEIVNKYNKGEELTQEEMLSMQVEILQLLTGKTEDEILSLPLPKVRRLNERCLFLREKVAPVPMKGKYKVGGLILEPCKDIKHWTTSQFVDYQGLLKMDNTAGLLACMLIPRGKTYGNGYDVMEVKDAINKEMSIEDAMAVSAFFLNKYTASLRNLITSSVKETIMDIPTWKGKMEMVKEMRAVIRSIKDGDGLLTLMQSQRSLAKTGMQSKK